MSMAAASWLSIVHPVNSQVETALVVVNAASTIVGAFRKSGGGGVTKILLAISENVAQINRGMQVALSELQKIREGQAKIPQNVYEYFSVRAVSGQIQALNELREQGQQATTEADRYAYFRDLFAVYEDVRKARQQVLNDTYEVSENLILHLPLLFMIEQEAYALLTGALTGDQSDNILLPFAVSEASWLTSLKSYLTFYNQAVDRDLAGSFANERADTQRSIASILDAYGSRAIEELWISRASRQDEVVCYFEGPFVSTVSVGSVTDGGGRAEEIFVDYKSYDYFYRRYSFEAEDGELIAASFEDVGYGRTTPETEDYAIRQQEDSEVERLRDETGINCSSMVAKAELPKADPFYGLDVAALNNMIVRLGFLRAIDVLDRQTAAMLAEQVVPYDDKIDISDYPKLKLVAETLE